jgi:hypothetical protein
MKFKTSTFAGLLSKPVPVVFGWLVLLRFLFAFIRTFFPPILPHAHRQVDTLGVSLRYWNRWNFEPTLQHPLLPAVIDRGENYGIQAMELPIFNLVTAPAFALGPFKGMMLAQFIYLMICVGLWLISLRVYKNIRIAGISAHDAIFVLPIVSLGGLYLGRFMPDFISMMLVLISIGLSWQQPRILASVLLASLGLMLKPPSVIVFGLLLLHEDPRRSIRQSLPWVVLSVALGAAYFKFGLAYIRQFQESSDLFFVELRDPFLSLQEFFTNPKELYKLFANKLFFEFGTFVMGAVLIAKLVKGKVANDLKLWALILIQVLFIGSLDGNHAYIHEYYFIGISMTCCLIFLSSWNSITQNIWRIIVVIALTAHVVDKSQVVKGFLFHEMYDTHLECDELKDALPDLPWRTGFVFRTLSETYPRLALCFGERISFDDSMYLLAYRRDPIPDSCQVLAKKDFVLVAKCD